MAIEFGDELVHIKENNWEFASLTPLTMSATEYACRGWISSTHATLRVDVTQR